MDFGSVGRIDDRLREYIENVLIGIANGDPELVASVIVRVGLTPPDLDEAALRTDVIDYVSYYGAQPLDPEAAAAAGPELSFEIPSELPGGFVREQAYRLAFGEMTGIAATYRSGTEPLVVFFHPPIDPTKLGLHRESHCHVAGREGQRVEVGPWRLIHFTDPTTCHCLLIKSDEDADILAVMERIAPAFIEVPEEASDVD